MKTKIFKLTVLIAGLLILSSCSELLYTSLDVLRPAKVTFAPNANNILLVNNTVNQPSNLGHRTLLFDQKTKNAIVKTDSVALFCLSSLTENLENNGFFSTVNMIPATQNTNSNFIIINPLDSTSIAKLCSKNHADVILSLDKIKVNDDISEYFLNESNTFLATLEVRCESTWSIHYPTKTESKSIILRDTLYWESESYQRNKAMNGLPNRNDGIVDGALNLGKKSVNYFIPNWEKVDRYFYKSPNKYIKQGMDSVYVKNWKSAISTWGKAYKSKNAWTQAQAANNIAIAYEISGDVDKALEYATQAYYLFGKSYYSDMKTFIQFSEYMNDLNQRKKDIEIIKKQLGE